MRWVQDAPIRPSRCAVFPQIGQHHELGFIDTGSELPGGGTDGRWDNHVYVSVVAVRELAGHIGYVDPTELRDRVAVLEGQLESQAADLAEANRALDAIDVLESKDFTRRRKPGRPPKREEAVV